MTSVKSIKGMQFTGTCRENNGNSTIVQRRNNSNTREGVIVNTFVKDSINNNMNDICSGFIIPQKTDLPEDLFIGEKKTFWGKILSSPITPLCTMTIGLLGGTALITKALHTTAKMKLTPTLEHLPDLPRNMNLLNENEFVTYVAVQNPNFKTGLCALAAITFASSVFIMKNFIDGFKEVWVKKQEADIQRNLQENLIAVETRSFSGKNQIIRNMLKEKSDEINEVLNAVNNRKTEVPSAFKGFNISFGSNTNKQTTENKSKSSILYPIIGIATLGVSVLLTKQIHKHIKNIGKIIEKSSEKLHKRVDVITAQTADKIMGESREELINTCSALNLETDVVKERLTKVGLKEDQILSLITAIEEKRDRKFVQAPEALGGRKGIQYYSYISDAQGHFYNWIMNKGEEPAESLTKNLFLALATVSGLSYLGKTSVEAIREVQVKKSNANTELELHKKLVHVELKNFLAKKSSIIEPLVKEFKSTARQSSDNAKLKLMADDVLYEVKNGAPFVYS